jgi:predicted alpha/beta superfamily hydrolase
VAIAGASLGALSAMDIAWQHNDKIDAVGCFSGSFWWRDVADTQPGYSDSLNRIMLRQIKQSRKKPNLQVWLYSGGKEEKADRDKDGITDVVDDTRDLQKILMAKNMGTLQVKLLENPNGAHHYPSWSSAMPDFLTWIFPRQ